MCQALRELMKDEIQKDIEAGRAEGKAEGRAEGKAEGIFALVAAYREDMGLDDRTIIEKIAVIFGLTGEQAKAFVSPNPV